MRVRGTPLALGERKHAVPRATPRDVSSVGRSPIRFGRVQARVRCIRIIVRIGTRIRLGREPTGETLYDCRTYVVHAIKNAEILSLDKLFKLQPSRRS